MKPQLQSFPGSLGYCWWRGTVQHMSNCVRALCCLGRGLWALQKAVTAVCLLSEALQKYSAATQRCGEWMHQGWIPLGSRRMDASLFPQMPAQESFRTPLLEVLSCLLGLSGTERHLPPPLMSLDTWGSANLQICPAREHGERWRGRKWVPVPSPAGSSLTTGRTPEAGNNHAAAQALQTLGGWETERGPKGLGTKRRAAGEGFTIGREAQQTGQHCHVPRLPPCPGEPTNEHPLTQSALPPP